MDIMIQVIENPFSVCKIEHLDYVDFSADYFFLSKSDEEISLVCPTSLITFPTLAREDNWRAFRIKGTLDFSLVGLLAEISTALAAEQIGIFAISTYNTDYILTKAENFADALRALAKQGYVIEE